MDELGQALKLDYGSLFWQIMIIIVAVIFIVKSLSEFTNLFKKPKSWVDMNNSDHQKILQMQEKLNKHLAYSDALKETSKQRDNQVTSSLKQLKEMFVKKDIQDIKYTVLDFASGLNAGRLFNRQQFDTILEKITQYDEYVLEYGIVNHKMKNSVQFIQHVYKKAQEKGFVGNQAIGIKDI